MTPQREFRRTLQKGFRKTGNPDLVNDLFRYTPNYINCYTLGIVQDTALTRWDDISFGIYWERINPTNYIGHKIYVSESFILKFQDKIEWNTISRRQVLSEAFIREFQDKLHWAYISEYQILSDSFVQEFRHKWN